MSCSHSSRQNNEHWLGTASPAQVWIALSHPKPWGATALASIAIGDQNRKHLTSLFSLYNDSRIQIITRTDSKDIILFFAVAFEHDQRLYRIPLESYDQIVNLNWQDIIANKPEYQKYLSSVPIYLICTNDQHDPCCGERGQALFDQYVTDEQVWQCSHLGGDRFAANMVSLPTGSYYRRVDATALNAIIAAEQKKQVQLDHFAGRSCYDRITQVALYYLLKTFPGTTINDWTWIRKEESKLLIFDCIFQNKEGTELIATIEQINTGISDFFTCNATTKTEIVYFQFHGIEFVSK